MRINKIILTLIISLSAINSYAQTCKGYITDEWSSNRYTNNGDGTIVDNKTKLTWKQCSEGLSGAGCSLGVATTYNRQEALQLGDSSFAGDNDWRLPNIKELGSLVARNCENPSINIALFPNTPEMPFWTSTPFSKYSNGTWLVHFDYGYDNLATRIGNVRVRLVRGGE